MARALVVDDEANIRDLVAVYLRAAGFEVEEAADGTAALELVAAQPFDVAVLDLMLPGVDGAEVCRRIRERSGMAVLMLTARDDEMQRISLLEGGADDYITKPFSPPELVARVHAVLRRVNTASSSDRRVFGELVLDERSREVVMAGKPVQLTAKEFDILAAMMREPGVVFTREHLLEAAWGFSDFVDLRGIDVHIRHLRAKLGDDAVRPRFIETVRGIGYRFRRSTDEVPHG